MSSQSPLFGHPQDEGERSALLNASGSSASAYYTIQDSTEVLLQYEIFIFNTESFADAVLTAFKNAYELADPQAGPIALFSGGLNSAAFCDQGVDDGLIAKGDIWGGLGWIYTAGTYGLSLYLMETDRRGRCANASGDV
jgi:hypothetical protein